MFMRKSARLSTAVNRVARTVRKSRSSTASASVSRTSRLRCVPTSLRANAAQARALVLVEHTFIGPGKRRGLRAVTEETIMRAPPILVSATLALAATPAFAQQVDWGKVDAAFGRKGAMTGGVHRYGFP